MSVSDVLIAMHFSDEREDYSGPGADDLLWYCENRHGILDDLSVGALKGGETRRIMDACEPRGLDFSPTRQFGTYYVIVRENPIDPTNDNWDSDQVLRRLVAFSRLVHITPLGYDFCARITRGCDDTISRAAPYPGREHAYCGCLERPWLTRNEWTQVGQLLQTWKTCAAKECEQVNRAVFFRELAALQYYVDVRCAHLVTAVEALTGHWSQAGTKNSKHKLRRGKRFSLALTRMAEDSEIELGTDDADGIWKLRSHSTHGRNLPQHHHRDFVQNGLLDTFERVLGTCLQRVITDDGYAANFAEDEAITSWLGRGQAAN